MNDVRFQQLIAAHGALIRRIARSYEANAARADELVQDIHLAIWQSLPRFRGESSERTFLARIAHNRAISHVAREAKVPRTSQLDGELAAVIASPEEQVAQADLRAKLELAVQALPLNLKVVVTLALEGFSPEDIADVLGLNVSAASVRLHRGKALLKDMMKGSVT
jgi:RNA polymerase sigma-70 factor (ECF subfamily)